MAFPGSILARQVLDMTGATCYKLYTQQRAHDRSYKIFGSYKQPMLNLLMIELAARGAKNVRAVGGHRYTGGNAGIRFEY